MSILIRGINLPEAYTSAWLTVFECVGEHTFIKTHKVSAEQMQAIPPHGRLIDADETKEALRRAEALIRAFGYHNVIQTVSEVPTIIEAEEGAEE